MVRVRQVGDDAVVPAGPAITGVALRLDQPVAGIVSGIGAEHARPSPIGQGRKAIAVGLDSRQLDLLRQEAELVAAFAAAPVFKIKNVATGLADKEFQGTAPLSRHLLV